MHGMIGVKADATTFLLPIFESRLRSKRDFHDEYQLYNISEPERTIRR